jgi:hypothetical protein
VARYRRALFVAGSLMIVCAASLSAQRTVTRQIWVSAVDASGTPVLDLTAADFKVTESGVVRPVSRITLGTAPMRVVLLVDSSTPVGPMMTSFRAALNAFVDALTDEHEVTLISSGGQIRVRTTPSTDRDKLRTEIARFASEGGANAFLDTLLEADKRFMKTAPAQWPVFVILTTDNGDGTREPDVKAYNTFMNDFLSRGGTAHAVIVSGKRTGSTTDLVTNLVDNTGGIRHSVITDNVLPARLTEIGDRMSQDHALMVNRYEVAYAGDPKSVQPVVNIEVDRDNVRLKMSVRRPF